MPARNPQPVWRTPYWHIGCQFRKGKKPAAGRRSPALPGASPRKCWHNAAAVRVSPPPCQQSPRLEARQDQNLSPAVRLFQNTPGGDSRLPARQAKTILRCRAALQAREPLPAVQTVNPDDRHNWHTPSPSRSNLGGVDGFPFPHNQFHLGHSCRIVSGNREALDPFPNESPSQCSIGNRAKPHIFSVGLCGCFQNRHAHPLKKDFTAQHQSQITSRFQLMQYGRRSFGTNPGPVTTCSQ